MKYIKRFETHTEYETYIGGQDVLLPNVSYCEDNNEAHYNQLDTIIATDDTNLPLMNMARACGWIGQDATEFYESEAKAVTNITNRVVNTFVNTHTQETINTEYGSFTLDLWYDKDENKWYDTTSLGGGDDFALTDLISFETVRPEKSQDSETATLYGLIEWVNIEHFDEFQYFTNITSINSYAFDNCIGLTSIVIPNSVTSIGKYAFTECSGLISVTIPSSVTSIGEYAFYECNSLTNVTIPDNVTSIGNNAFYGCSSLTSIVIPDSITSISEYTFDGCSGLTNVTIPNSVTNIGDGAFSQCSNLTSIAIPNSVTSIGGGAFYLCTSLTSIIIPNSVINIDQSAFHTCSGLISIVIGNGVTNIGDVAFGSCSSLTSVTVEATTPPSAGSSIFYYASNCPIYVPTASVDTYKAASGWSKYADRIQAIPTT